MIALPLQDGLIWSDQVISSEEGPYTAACKLATLNAQPVRTLLTRVFGRLAQRLARERHPTAPATSMNASWLELYATETDEVTAVGREILTRSLVSQLGDFAFWISNVNCFRYCPQCLELGFQSALHQISAIVRCPIHGCALLTTCERCGASTPRYTVFDAFKAKLQCLSCREPFSRAWHPDGHVVFWQRPSGHEILLEAKNSLEAFQRLIFGHYEGYHLHFSKLPEECIRIAYFALANAAIGPTISADFLDPRAISAQPLTVGAKPPDSQSFKPRARPCPELTSAYLAVNELLRRSIGASRIARLMQLPSSTRSRDFRSNIALDGNDPEALAFALWRLRSDEGIPDFNVEPRQIRSTYALYWKDHTISLIDWMNYLYLTFDAELRLATSWCHLLAAVNNNPNKRQKLYELFSGFFQLAGSPSPPAMTKVIVLPSPRKNSRYFFCDVECDVAFWDASTLFPIDSSPRLRDLME